MSFDTKREATEYIKSKTGFFGDPVDYYEIRETGGCYLTTATVDYMGLADEGAELTALRDFRDRYLLTFEEGEKDVEHYYQIAPQLVKIIQQSDRRAELLNSIYQDLILPCLTLIKEGKFAETHQLYKNYTLALEKELLH
ncbi:CFI-box-CTERM domain-containing protein [Streptococcus marmotae]|uniref:CFI-box-CTERM domain-containing protein n=1 Tax=Streptococcus marmotae TaxID=1825069 RepID=UPI000A70204E|nr:CFI-box-CTERM domain-containing protein [Streptococcus marmotae]